MFHYRIQELKNPTKLNLVIEVKELLNLPLDLPHRHIYTRHQLMKNGWLLHRHILALLAASMHLPKS